jgi:tetratricopeptide (TPR) repeat protein
MINLRATKLIWTAICRSGQIGLSFLLLISGGMLAAAQPTSAQPQILISQLTVVEYWAQGTVRLNQGDYHGAIAKFNQALQLDPNYASAYLFRGVAKAALGDYQGVIADMNQTLKLDPNNPNSHLIYGNRSVARAALGDYQGAIADYSQLIRLNPNSSSAYLSRSVVKANLGDHQGAIADSNQALQLDPKLAPAYANRSESFSILGRASEALRDAEQAIRLDPKLHYGYIVRGAAHISAGNFSAAQTDLEQALRLNPKEGFVYYWRGLLAFKQGKYAQAISDYEQGVRLTPTVAAKGYENYSLTARRQLETTKVATPAPPPIQPPSPPAPPTIQPPAPTAVQSPPVTPSQPSPVATAPSTTNVYSTASATTVRIEGQNSGSGVIFSKQGNTYYVLTAKHVVATLDQYEIVTPSGKTYAVDYARVTKLANIDLAVIPFTSNEALSLVKFGNSQAVSQGNEINISGWPIPDAAITQPSHLVIPGVVVGIQNNNKDGYALLYNNSTSPGMSGGPIFNREGQMIGIHGRASGNQESGKVGINLGIPVHLFLQQASQAGLNLQTLGLQSR